MTELSLYIYLLILSMVVAAGATYTFFLAVAVVKLRQMIKGDESVMDAVDAALDAHVKKIARLEYQVQQLSGGEPLDLAPLEDSTELFTEDEIKESSQIADMKVAYEKYMDSHAWRHADDGMFHTEDIVVVEMPTKTPKSKKKSKK